jgi:hypothetical protein
MSDMAKQARAAMKAKASKMTTADPHQKVDSSTWTPPEPLNTEAKTGLRPISRRAFKKGGKVMGSKPKANLGRAPRKSGGEATQYANAKVNRNVKDANEERPGIKHVGALKTGGRAKKQAGGKNMIMDSRTPQPSPENMPITPEMERRMQSIMDAESRKSREYEARDRAKRDYEVTGQKRGGRTGKAGGGAMAGAQKMLQEAQQTAGVPSATLGFTGIKKGSLSPARGVGLKKGGAAKHDDVKQDMALIKKMIKPASLRKGKEEGGGLTRHYLAMKNPIRERHIEEAAYDASERDPSRNKGQGPTKENAATFSLRKAVGKDPYAALERKSGGKAKRKGRDDGGRLSESTRAAKASRDAYDARVASRKASKDLHNYVATPEFDSKLAQAESIAENSKVMRKRADNIGKQTGYSSFSGDPEINSGVDYGRLRSSPLIGTYRSNASQTPSAYEEAMQRGGKAKRTARKEGGGVFSGPGYPGKVPGVTGGRIARATGGKTKSKGKTNINIVIAAGKPAGAQDMMGPPPGMDAGPQGLPIPVPPPQGGMPMGGGAPMPMPMPMPAGPAPGPAPMPRKSGGRLTAKASSYKDMTAGSGGGEGRLQKTDIAKLHKDAPAFKAGGKVYRSYKDMDAGAGSGLGRLEKTEIQKRKG